MFQVWQPVDGLGDAYTVQNPSARRHVTPLYTGLVALADAIGTHHSTVRHSSSYISYCSKY